jgi:hypothetical protein
MLEVRCYNGIRRRTYLSFRTRSPCPSCDRRRLCRRSLYAYGRRLWIRAQRWVRTQRWPRGRRCLYRWRLTNSSANGVWRTRTQSVLSPIGRGRRRRQVRPRRRSRMTDWMLRWRSTRSPRRRRGRQGRWCIIIIPAACGRGRTPLILRQGRINFALVLNLGRRSCL